MIRTKNIKNVDAILCSDMHLREDIPTCRGDDFPTEQWRCLDFISDLQKKYDCPVLHAGDLFHHWKPSPWLLSETMKHLPKHFYTVYGNHDLPQHNIELASKCGIYTLECGECLSTFRPNETFEFCHWNEIPVNIGEKVLLWHIFNYQGKEPWPGCTEPQGISLLKKYPEYDLIVTGDNHTPFVEEYQGRLLVNPGCMTAQKANETHKPRVYLWHAEENTVTTVYLPIEENVINRDHLEKEQQRNDRIQNFVTQLNDNWKVSLSFEDNLQRFEKKNRVRDEVMQIVYKSIGQ